MTHSELCLETARHFSKEPCKLCLCEYKSFISEEQPDVLCIYFDKSILFEIKMSRADFLADQKKECRKKYVPYSWAETGINSSDSAIRRAWIQFKQGYPQLFYVEKPHLGNSRYYVCPNGMLAPEEMPEGWGLYWYDENKKRFIQKKESGKFRSNMKKERDLAIHAMRRFSSKITTGIIVNTF